MERHRPLTLGDQLRDLPPHSDYRFFCIYFRRPIRGITFISRQRRRKAGSEDGLEPASQRFHRESHTPDVSRRLRCNPCSRLVMGGRRLARDFEPWVNPNALYPVQPSTVTATCKLKARNCTVGGLVPETIGYSGGGRTETWAAAVGIHMFVHRSGLGSQEGQVIGRFSSESSCVSLRALGTLLA